MTIPSLGPLEELTPEQQRLVAAGINGVLKELGRQEEDTNGWWNLMSFPELGGKTPTQAWLSGQKDDVRKLIISLQERSLAGAKRAMANPATKGMLQKELAKLG